MIISHSALLCLEATWQRLIGRAAPELELDVPSMLAEQRHLAPLPVSRGEDTAPELAPHATFVELPQPIRVEAEPIPDRDAPLSPAERRARAAGLRALTLSRGRKFAAARAAFVEAARLDPLLDLTRIPGFWKLERSAHEAAVDAYLETGRDRDAAVLRARIQSTYRPKPVRSRAAAPVST
jgi:hypothetical protein